MLAYVRNVKRLSFVHNHNHLSVRVRFRTWKIFPTFRLRSNLHSSEFSNSLRVRERLAYLPQSNIKDRWTCLETGVRQCRQKRRWACQKGGLTLPVSSVPLGPGGEMDGRFGHGKDGSYQRYVDEGNIFPSAL